MSAAPAAVSRHSGWPRTVLMGDPTHFSVKGGANPHTRNWLGRRRRVDRARAVAQWQRLRDTLRDCGARVLVVPADADQPGLVYPANAGFLTEPDEERPLAEKTFYLSNLIGTRAGERQHYARVLRDAGFTVADVPERYRFEGEADFFPAGERYLLTHGRLERQRFVPRWGLPPWKRIYGFRTDREIQGLLEPLVKPTRVVALELVLEAHYHGDTALCAFGPEREYLLAWKPALAPDAWFTLRRVYGDHLIELGDEDARRYAANSFTLSRGDESMLFVPEGCSDRMLGRVRERGVTPIEADVSEFLKKGGGSVKCMIGDLGPVEEGVSLGSFEVAATSS